MSRFDVLKSLVHRAREAGREQLARAPGLVEFKRALSQIKDRRAEIGEGALAAAVAQADDIRASTVRIHDGRILVEATYTDGESLVFGLIPEDIRFAPRGAKEIYFRVDPSELAGKSRVRDAVGHIAALIARAVWGPVLPPQKGSECALTDREGDRLRVDLRSIPSVDTAIQSSPFSAVLDVITIESFGFGPRTLELKLQLPLPG